jgi:hypothetical protein
MITDRDDDYYRPRLIEAGIPPYMHDGLLDYLIRRRPPGHFLTAVLSNDLTDAVGRGDNTNLQALPQYVRFLYSSAPSNAWGSPAKVAAWLDERHP